MDSLFSHGDQSWSDPVISHLLEKEPELLQGLASASPSLALLVLRKTGGVMYDSTGGLRLAWLLQHRTAECVAVKELYERGYEKTEKEKLRAALRVFLSSPLFQPSVRKLSVSITYGKTYETTRDRSETLARFPALEELGFIVALTDKVELKDLAPLSSLKALTALQTHTGIHATPTLRLFSGCPLKQLEIAYTDTLKEDFVVSLGPATFASTLTHLDLSLRGVPSSLQGLSQLTALRSIKLGDLRDAKMKAVASALPKLTQLTSVRLQSGGMTSASRMLEGMGGLDEFEFPRFFHSVGPALPLSVRSLEIERCKLVDPDLLPLSNLSLLKSLSFERCSFECSDYVFEKISLTSLTRLRFFTNDGLPSLDFVQSLAFLKELDVSSPIWGRGFMSLFFMGGPDSSISFDLSRAPPSLVHLSLSDVDSLSLSPLSSLSNLSSLTLDAKSLEEDPSAPLFAPFSALTGLRDLALRFDGALTQALLERPFERFPSLPRLTSLSCFEYKAKDTAVDYFSVFSSLSRVETLRLGNQSLEPSSSWQSLSSFFPRLSSLDLHVEKSSLAPEHKEGLAKLSRLHKLSLKDGASKSSLKDVNFEGDSLRVFFEQ